HSPIRTNLPKMCGIENSIGPFEQLYAYRAFYNRSAEDESAVKYKIYLLPAGKLGIGWVAAEEEFTDLLIGRFEPFDLEQANTLADYFREANPRFGKELLRGGQFVNIPLRQTLAVMVCDGYAAIGDSAFMTMPIIGSGIANSLKAAKMLAETILADKAGAFSAEILWGYQVKYYSKIGAGLSQIACIKKLLLKITPEELDYCFAEGILTAQDFAFGSDNTSLVSMLKISPHEIKSRAQALFKDEALLKKIIALGMQIGKVAAVIKLMPRKWDKKAVDNWSRKYRKLFVLE
ncbi:MAG: hypothetical protein WCN92_03855, partial [Eubacteriales bacterium]